MASKPSPKSGISRLFSSFGYAFKGIAHLLRSQANARIHLLATIVVTGAGFLLEVDRMEWVALVLCMAGVWTSEAMNTAIEYLTDLVSPDFNPIAGKVKDIAAGGVLLFAIATVIVAGLIFIPRIIPLLEL